MARTPKPWWWAERGSYYVTLWGIKTRLDPNEKKSKSMLRQLQEAGKPKPTLPSDSAILIIDEFLLWCQTNRPSSYDWYFQYLNPFCQCIDGLKVDQVKSSHVTKFIAKDSWGQSAKRAAVTAIKRAFNWAVKEDMIPASPVQNAKKPDAVSREQVISREQHEAMLTKVSKPFAELLELAWETGARPFELFRLETRHLELKAKKAVFPKAESKGKKKSRVLYFSDRAMEIIKRNMQSKGPVLRNSDGSAWTAYSINCAFNRLQAAMGKEQTGTITLTDEEVKARMKKIEASRKKKELPPLPVSGLRTQARSALRSAKARGHATKFCLYNYRHTFGHRKLTEGMDSMVVATLMGHSSTAMLERVYGHIHKNQDFLLAQLNK